MVLVAGFSRLLSRAEGQTDNTTNPAVEITGGYAPTQTNGDSVFVDPSEFWCGPGEEGTNGWRVQLRIYNRTNFALRAGAPYPLTTNLMLSVEWGSPVKNSGGGYFLTPNGKFAKFELLDAKGNVLPPTARAGVHALGELRNVNGVPPSGLSFRTNPAWLSLESGLVVSTFPETISTNVYPIGDTDQMPGEIWSLTNRLPAYISLLEMDKVYCVTNEGDYTLTVQPVLYKQGDYTDASILDRVDLPSVTTKIHLAPVFGNIGGYSMMRGTDGFWKYVNQAEFWRGTWKEDGNGWRTQLQVYLETNYWYSQAGVTNPVSTNLMLMVQWGSAIKDSGGGYYMTPNGKFAKFELLDDKGNIVPPNPKAGTNLLLGLVQGPGLRSFDNTPLSLSYPPDLPKWADPASGPLVADFPNRISAKVYPRYSGNGYMASETGASTNVPPSYVGLLKLDQIYSVTHEGDS